MIGKASLAFSLFIAVAITPGFAQNERRERSFVCDGSVAAAALNPILLQVSGVAHDPTGNSKHIVTLTTADGRNSSFDLTYDPESKSLAITRTDFDGSSVAVGSENAAVSLVTRIDNTRTSVKCAIAK